MIDREALSKRLADVATKLENLETLPKPYNLYYAVKNDGHCWQYFNIDIGVTEIRQASEALSVFGKEALIDRKALQAAIERATVAACAATDPLRSIDRIVEKAITAYLTSAGEGAVPVGWPAPKVTNPDIANPTGNPYIDSLIHRLLDAQQDINAEAYERMSQPLCDASALLDEVETAIRKLAAAPHSPRQDGAREGEVTRRLGDLLAVIHRDGGHYLAEHGLEKACFDAIEKVIGWLSIEDTTPPAPDEAVEAEREAIAAWLEKQDGKGWFHGSLSHCLRRLANAIRSRRDVGGGV